MIYPCGIRSGKDDGALRDGRRNHFRGGGVFELPQLRGEDVGENHETATGAMTISTHPRGGGQEASITPISSLIAFGQSLIQDLRFASRQLLRSRGFWKHRGPILMLSDRSPAVERV